MQKRLFSSMLAMVVAAVGVTAAPLLVSAADLLYVSPHDNLEAIDMTLLRHAHNTVDIAMYAFTDKKLAKELVTLAHKGVKIRLYRDGTQLKDKGDTTATLLEVPGIEVRAKPSKFWNIQHIKGYVVDGKILREGSANWSPAGEGASCYHGKCGHDQQQDNDILITDDKKVTRHFEANFNHIWARKSNCVDLAARACR